MERFKTGLDSEFMIPADVNTGDLKHRGGGKDQNGNGFASFANY
jgi:hypothetical protein